jgi:hypothetical protein
MRRILRGTAAVTAGLMLAGCAAQAGGAAPAPSPSPSESRLPAPSDPADGGLTLQISYTDGATASGSHLSRLPLVSLYADGRFIYEGATPAIHPGPALNGALLSRLAPERVDEIVQQALDAGLGEASDYGRPSSAEAPSARFTLVTRKGTAVTNVYLPDQESRPVGLGDEQAASWERLLTLIGYLNDVKGDVMSSLSTHALYEPEAVAAVVTPWTDADDGIDPEPVAWPGPSLPGDPLDPEFGVTCVTAAGAAADAVLDAAKSATDITPWTDEDGTRWSVTLRPLLPHERSCADLPAA